MRGAASYLSHDTATAAQHSDIRFISPSQSWEFRADNEMRKCIKLFSIFLMITFLSVHVSLTKPETNEEDLNFGYHNLYNTNQIPSHSPLSRTDLKINMGIPLVSSKSTRPKEKTRR